MHRGPSQGDRGSSPPKVLACYKHVTGRAGPGRAAGVGAVTFLQNHYRVPHVAVHKVDQKVGARCHLPLVPPHYKTKVTCRYREGDPIHPGVRCVRWCRPLRWTLLNVLGLFMGCQRPHCQLHLALQNTKLSPAADTKRMDPRQSSAMYTLPLSVCQKCIRDEKPPQLICLCCSVGPTCNFFQYIQLCLDPVRLG